jgi:hypothetical protein
VASDCANLPFRNEALIAADRRNQKSIRNGATVYYSYISERPRIYWNEKRVGCIGAGSLNT